MVVSSRTLAHPFHQQNFLVRLTWRNIPFRGEPHGERRPIISPVPQWGSEVASEAGLWYITEKRSWREQMIKMQTFSINHLACGVCIDRNRNLIASPSS
jgi:hypothetical protein